MSFAPRRGRSAGRPAGTGSDESSDRDQVEPTEAELESQARAIALRRLTGAPRSRHQLAEAMAQRDIPPEVAERVLDRFVEVGLIDDAEYARMLVRSQRESRGLARRALSVELRRKGVGAEDAEAALAEIDGEAEEESARELLRKRLRPRPGVDPAAQQRRALGMLARKGYPPGLSARLVREFVVDTEGDPWETLDVETD